jgi:hypothetical protein
MFLFARNLILDYSSHLKKILNEYYVSILKVKLIFREKILFKASFSLNFASLLLFLSKFKKKF